MQDIQFVNTSLVASIAAFDDFLGRHLSQDGDLADKKWDGEIPDEFSTAPLLAAVATEIERISAEVVRAHPELSAEGIREFRFALAAWADEVIIKTLPEHSRSGRKGGVEYELFGTVNAGDRFFGCVERVLDRRGLEDMGLAAVYLIILSMGFEGRFIGGAGREELSRYQAALRALALASPTLAMHKPLETDPDADMRRLMGFVRPQGVWIATLLLWLLAVLATDVYWSFLTAPLAQDVQAAWTKLSPASEGVHE